MAVRGFFSPTHLVFGNPPAPTEVPYVGAEVVLPSLGTRALVQFLVDTGADITVLNPQDSLRLLPPDAWARLGQGVTIGGAGANLTHYSLDAVVHFLHDDGLLEHVPTTLYVATPHQANFGLESLLGRDLLSHFVMTFDQAGRALTLA